MSRYDNQYDEWNNQPQGADVDYDAYEGDPQSEQYGMMPYPDSERGVGAAGNQSLPSLVGVSATITNYGAPLLSYTRTMTRFYQSRKQVMSFGRIKCAICNDRITGWAWTTPGADGHAHDGCYDRLAWAWASVYAEQQQTANRGQTE